MDSEPQARAAADARRQPAVPAETEVRGDHGLRSPSAGVSESGATDDADRRRSVVAGPDHLRPGGSGVRVPGGHTRGPLPARDRLGAGLYGQGMRHARTPRPVGGAAPGDAQPGASTYA